MKRIKNILKRIYADRVYAKLQKKQQYAVEKKYNGFHVLLHKKGNEVKIFSEHKRDITESFPEIVYQAKKHFKGHDLIFDCEFVPYDEHGKPLGRDQAAHYIAEAKKGKQLPIKPVFHVFDVLYWDEDITQKPWHERKAVMKKLKDTDNIKFVESIIVSSPQEMEKAIKTVADLPGSEGAVIKKINDVYTPGKKTDAFIKYRVELHIDAVVIEKIKTKSGNAYNYLIGVYIPKNKVNRFMDKYVVEVKGKPVLKLGKTFNTKLEADVGDILAVNIEEVWRHKDEETGKIRYSIHKPKVMEVEKDRKETTSVDDLDAMVVARGVEVIENRADAEGGGEKEDEVKDFPKRMQEAFKKAMGKWHAFVLQWHLRGQKSLHTDLRMKVNDHLEGFTLFDPASVDDNDIKLETGPVRGTIKLPQPLSWLTFEGKMPKGGVGATKNYPAYFVIVGHGKYRPLIVEDHRIVLEFKSDDFKVKKIPEEGEPDYVKKFNEKLPERSIKLNGYYEFMVAHIGDKHIMLWKKLKNAPKIENPKNPENN